LPVARAGEPAALGTRELEANRATIDVELSLSLQPPQVEHVRGEVLEHGRAERQRDQRIGRIGVCGDARREG
jgi:hypothetical protein